MFKITEDITTVCILGLLLFCTSSSALAEENGHRQGWYISSMLGITSMKDTAFNIPSVVYPRNGKLIFDDDSFSFISTALGYKWKNFRVEGEVLKFNNTIHSLLYDQHAAFDAEELVGLNRRLRSDGHFRIMGYMANLWCDFDTETKWSPYIGGGVGVLVTKLIYTFEEMSDDPSLPASQKGHETLTNDLVPAFQFGAGIGYELNESITLQLGYRFLYGGDVNFYSYIRTIQDGSRFEINGVKSYSILLGIRINLY